MNITWRPLLTTHLKETRRRWLADFPEDEMPPHEEPPYDRDRQLPRTHSGAETDESDELM